MLTPTEFTSAVDHVNKLVKVVVKAFPKASHAEIAQQALVAWGEKREGLENTLSKLGQRKTKSVATQASINTKQDQLDSLDEIQPILDAMLDLLRKQAKPQMTEVKKAA